MKKCRGCEIEKTEDNFYLQKSGYLYPYCKPCNSIRSRDWKRNNKEKHYHNQIKDKFKMTAEQHKILLDTHFNRCGICGKHEASRRLSVDHCHKTNVVRGILCRRCNLGISYFYDDVKLIKSAMTYLGYEEDVT